MMKSHIQQLKKTFISELKNIKDLPTLQDLEQRFFSRKSGEMTGLMKQLKEASGDIKKELGQLVNELKQDMEMLLEQKKQEFEQSQISLVAVQEAIDVTQPRLPTSYRGHLHPVSQIQYTIEDFFTSMGFMVADGPELESDYYNFESVNIPKDHPARDMQDTFYVKDHPTWVMRTHTSSVQVRAMQRFGAPIRAIVPGTCFRNEATDVRHEHTFSQVEGLVVDKGITFSHMKGVLEAIAKHLYGQDTQVRLRPKFYPFVEPGVNGEVTCYLCKGKGCRLCKQSGWLEIFGAGMIHPNVLKEGGVDPSVYSGFAFGMGLDRLVMLRYGIEDIRHFHAGDYRFLSQF